MAFYLLLADAPRPTAPSTHRHSDTLTQATPLALLLLLLVLCLAGTARPALASPLGKGTTAADLADAGAADDARTRADALYRRAVAIRCVCVCVFVCVFVFVCTSKVDSIREGPRSTRVTRRNVAYAIAAAGPRVDHPSLTMAL